MQDRCSDSAVACTYSDELRLVIVGATPSRPTPKAPAPPGWGRTTSRAGQYGLPVPRHELGDPARFTDRTPRPELQHEGFDIEDGRAVHGIAASHVEPSGTRVDEFAGREPDPVGSILRSLGQNSDARPVGAAPRVSVGPARRGLGYMIEDEHHLDMGEPLQSPGALGSRTDPSRSIRERTGPHSSSSTTSRPPRTRPIAVICQSPIRPSLGQEAHPGNTAPLLAGRNPASWRRPRGTSLRRDRTGPDPHVTSSGRARRTPSPGRGGRCRRPSRSGPPRAPRWDGRSPPSGSPPGPAVSTLRLGPRPH